MKTVPVLLPENEKLAFVSTTLIGELVCPVHYLDIIEYKYNNIFWIVNEFCAI